jgi:hypothetical protein
LCAPASTESGSNSINLALAVVTSGFGTAAPLQLHNAGGEFGHAEATLLASRVKLMDKPMGNEEMQAAIKELQDTMVVMAHIEKTQSEHIQELVHFRIQSEKFRLRTEENLAEITDKLNGLIGYVAGHRPEDPKR